MNPLDSSRGGHLPAGTGATRSKRSSAFRNVGVALALCGAFTAQAMARSGDDPPLGSEDAPVLLDLPDSVRTRYTASKNEPLPLETFEVRARRILRELGADRIELDAGLIESQDGGSVADLGALLPSTHLTVNSRGEALFQVRGSSERHLSIELDGIPLTLPWDERADLSLLPLLGVGSVSARRGTSSVLDSPNALAGIIALQPRVASMPGSTTRLGSWIGESEAGGAQLLHLRRDGAWNTTLAVEHRWQGALLLPAELDVDYFEGERRVENQDLSRRVRTNTDLEQSALLLRVGREFSPTENVRVLVQASDGEKGVAPESNLEPSDARFWRYPDTQRVLVGLGADAGIGAWRLGSVASFDVHDQDTDEYDDARYAEVTGFERGRDRTALGRLTLGRGLGERWDLAVRGTVRHATRGQEEDGLDGELRFAQTLGGVAGELVFRPARATRLRAGAGYEGARTPRTGDKPVRDADHELAVHAAVEHDLGGGGRLHATASRRPRFPSMRELFSEALDSFLVNPDLGPEVQTAGELGYSHRARLVEFSVNAFAQLVDGAIERQIVEVEGRRLRQRVNFDEIRTLGLEFGGVARPLRGVTLDAQHTQLWSRSKVDGDFDGAVEDRPDWLTSVAASFTHLSGVRVRTELVGVGPRASLGVSGLEQLDTDLRWNLRLSYRHFGTHRWYEGSEVFVRVDNLLDATTEAQIGILESGRAVRVGWRLDLRS